VGFQQNETSTGIGLRSVKQLQANIASGSPIKSNNPKWRLAGLAWHTRFILPAFSRHLASAVTSPLSLPCVDVCRTTGNNRARVEPVAVTASSAETATAL
jgi:hypothetical protein